MRALAVVMGLAVVFLSPAFALAGRGHGLALLIYALVVAALALLFLVNRLSRALPRKVFSWSPRSQESVEEHSIAQLEKIEQALTAARWNESHLHELLRPVVREIVAARLRRHHRVDLDNAPDRAHAILGDGYAWNLARSDREPPLDPRARGWSRGELEKLIDELEAL
ncbi:MAG: hypothetical protein ABSC36_02295 [Gaiellaceae bacterium]|jgi:hypothetical protein